MRWFSCTYAELLHSVCTPSPGWHPCQPSQGPSRASCCSYLAHTPMFSSEQSIWCWGVESQQAACTDPTPDTLSTPQGFAPGMRAVGWILQQGPPQQWEPCLELLPLILPATWTEIASFVQDSNLWLLLSAYQHTLLLFLEGKIVWHIVLERLPTPHLHSNVIFSIGCNYQER